jgi:proteasome assembly chaperone (PAC2) family protein
MAVNIWEKPDADDIVMIAGWRQWADAGSNSSMLPKYLVQQTDAHKIGEISPDGFYIFQIPGTHDLVRPMIQFHEGYPETLETRKNEFYFAEMGERDVVVFIGDEPHLDIDRYVSEILQAAQELNVTRIITVAGVYAEVPYDKERPIGCIVSQRRLRSEMKDYAVDLSNYQGGASVGSYLCKRAEERDLEHIGFYAFAPTYDFSQFAQQTNGFRIENDFRGWLGVMRRLKHMLGLDFDLNDLEAKTADLDESIADKITELDAQYPELGVRRYFEQLSTDFEEDAFDPLSAVWEDELKRLLDDDENDE